MELWLIETTESKLLPKKPGSSKRVYKNNRVRALEQKSWVKDAEIERLQKQLAEVEVDRDSLKSELPKEQEKNDGVLQAMLKLLQA